MYTNVNKEILLLLAHARSVLLESITSFPEARTKKKKLQDTILNKLTDYQILEMVVGGRVVTSKKSDIARELVLHEAFTRIVSGSLLEMGSDKELCKAIRNSLPLCFYKMSSRFNEAKEYLKGKKKIPYVSLQEAPKIKAKIKQKLVKALISEARSVLDPLKEQELLAKAKMLLESDLNYDNLLQKNVALNEYDFLIPPDYTPYPELYGNPLRNYHIQYGDDLIIPPVGENPNSFEYIPDLSELQSALQRHGTEILDKLPSDLAKVSTNQMVKDIEQSSLMPIRIAVWFFVGWQLGRLLRQLHERYLSKAARECRGRKGTELDACIQKYKIQSLQAQIRQVQSSARLCSKTTNPQKCNQEIQKKIAKLRAKLQKNISESVQKKLLVKKESSYLAEWDAQGLLDFLKDLVEKAGGDVAAAINWLASSLPNLGPNGYLPFIPLSVFLAFMAWAIVQEKRIARNKAMPKCRGLSGEALKDCVRKYKIKDLQRQIRNLERSKQRVCPKTDNPPKCYREIDKRIQKLREDLNKKLAEDRQFSNKFVRR